MKKISLFLVIFALSIFSTFAKDEVQVKESWMYLQKAQQEFDNNKFAQTMKLVNEAVLLRNQECEKEASTITKAVTPYQVRRYGDMIEDVLKVLDERQEYAAIDIINKWVDKYSIEYFDDSIAKLINFIQARKNFPEACILIAKVYMLEGDFDQAMKYLEDARKYAYLLDIPEQENDIYFLIAEIAEFKQDVPTQEKALLLIAKNNGDFSNETLKKAVLRTSKARKEDNSSRFFKLYRIDGISSIKAYHKLSKIYDDSKKYQDAYLTNLYCALIGFTHLNSILEERQSDYQYEYLGTFFKDIARYPDIMKWCNENNLWESFYNIYTYGIKCEYTKFATDIITVLSKDCPEEYWKNAAKKCIN